MSNQRYETVTDSDKNLNAFTIFLFYQDLDSHEQELVYIGGCKVYDEKFKLEDNITCRIQAKLPVSIKNFVAGYAFGTAWICGGELCDGDGSPLNICYKFNKYDQVWEEEDGMNLPRKLAASAAIRTVPRRFQIYNSVCIKILSIA